MLQSETPKWMLALPIKSASLSVSAPSPPRVEKTSRVMSSTLGALGSLRLAIAPLMKLP